MIGSLRARTTPKAEIRAAWSICCEMLPARSRDIVQEIIAIVRQVASGCARAEQSLDDGLPGG